MKNGRRIRGLNDRIIGGALSNHTSVLQGLMVELGRQRRLNNILLGLHAATVAAVAVVAARVWGWL